MYLLLGRLVSVVWQVHLQDSDTYMELIRLLNCDMLYSKVFKSSPNEQINVLTVIHEFIPGILSSMPYV